MGTATQIKAPREVEDGLLTSRTGCTPLPNATDFGDYTIPDDVEVRREAFSCAAGLQNMHPIMQKVIAAREDARNARPARSG
jgi:hypothetical protein